MKKTHEQFIADQKQPVPPVEQVDLSGKVVAVIGANTGIGFEAVKHFARMNPAKLLLGCRSRERGEAAAKSTYQIMDEKDRVHLEIIDLASFESVCAFADSVDLNFQRLDILILNAAVAYDEHTTTIDGWKQTMQVNVLSQELLALLLLPMLFTTARVFHTIPRIVVVSSEVHYWAEFDFAGALSQPDIHRLVSNTTQSLQVYRVEKLLNVFFTRALNDRLPKSPSTPVITTVNPGFCITELRRHVTAEEELKRTKKMEEELGRTAEEGSRQVVFAAVTAAGHEESIRGQYIDLSEVREVSDFILSEVGQKTQNALWDDMIQILEKADPRVGQIVSEYLQK